MLIWIYYLLLLKRVSILHCYFDIVIYFLPEIKMGFWIEAHFKFHSSRQMDTEFHSTFPLELLLILSIQLFGDTVWINFCHLIDRERVSISLNTEYYSLSMIWREKCLEFQWLLKIGNWKLVFYLLDNIAYYY